MIINKPKRKRKRKTSRSSSHHLNLAESQVVFLVTIISDINKLPCHLQSIIKHSILASLQISRQSKTTFGIWPVRKRGGAPPPAQFRNFFLAKKDQAPPCGLNSVKQFLTPSLYCSYKSLLLFSIGILCFAPVCPSPSLQRNTARDSSQIPSNLAEDSDLNNNDCRIIRYLSIINNMRQA